MSYGPPTVPPAAPGPAAPKAPGGGLPAIGVLLLVFVLLNLAVLGYDLAQEGPGYLVTALGFSYDHVVDAPIGFFGFETAVCVTELVLAIAAFTGQRWVRGAAVALLAPQAYDSAANLIRQVTGHTGIASANSLLLNLDQLASILLTIVLAVVVLATRTPSAAPRPAFPPPYQPQPGPFAPPTPPADTPLQAPGYPAVQQQQPQRDWHIN